MELEMDREKNVPTYIGKVNEPSAAVVVPGTSVIPESSTKVFGMG